MHAAYTGVRTEENTTTQGRMRRERKLEREIPTLLPPPE